MTIQAEDYGDGSTSSRRSVITKSKKFWLGAGFALVVLAAAITNLWGDSTGNTNSFGPYSPKGHLSIVPQFQSIRDFSDGMAAYSTQPSNTPLFTSSGPGQPLDFSGKNEKWGYVSRNGSILPPIYSTSGDFVNGYAFASTDSNNYGLINKSGSWAIAPEYSSLGDYQNGLIAFQKKQGDKYGYLNIKGQIVIPAQWDYAADFSENFAQVCNGTTSQKCGFINSAGKVVIPLTYDYASNFSSGYSVVCNGKDASQLCGYVDSEGATTQINIKPFRSSEGIWCPGINGFSDGMASFGGRWTSNIQNWGFINSNLKLAIPDTINKELPVPSEVSALSSIAQDPWDFAGQVQWEVVGAAGTNPGLSAAMNKSGKILFYSTYQAVMPYSQGLSPVLIKGKWGFIDEKGKVVIRPQFDHVHGYSEGLAGVQVHGLWGFIN